MRVCLISLLLLHAAGCTTHEDGRGMAGLSASLQSRFSGLEAAAGRVGPDGWFKTDNSFELKLSALTLTVRDVRLQAASASGASGSGSCSFDPRNPPSGCTLCHGGHCHCGDKLVSYEELKAQACGGTGTATVTTVVTLPLGKAQGLLGLEGTTVDLSACKPSCELGPGQVNRVQLRLDRLKVQAIIRDQSLADRLSGKQPSVTVDWDLAGAALEHKLAVAEKMDRATPYHLELAVDLPVIRNLLDGIQWHKLDAHQGTITISTKTNKAAGEVLSTNLAATKLAAGVTRSDG